MGMKHKFFKKSFDYRSPTDCAKQILHVFSFCALLQTHRFWWCHFKGGRCKRSGDGSGVRTGGRVVGEEGARAWWCFKRSVVDYRGEAIGWWMANVMVGVVI